MDDTRGRLPVDARGKGADADGAAGGATKKAAVGKRNASTAIDSVWTHGIPFGSGFKCHYCNRAFSGGGATRFKEHLAGIIGNVEACQKVPKDVRKCMEESRTEGKRARAVNKARKKRIDDEIARSVGVEDVVTINDYGDDIPNDEEGQLQFVLKRSIHETNIRNVATCSSSGGGSQRRIDTMFQKQSASKRRVGFDIDLACSRAPVQPRINVALNPDLKDKLGRAWSKFFHANSVAGRKANCPYFRAAFKLTQQLGEGVPCPTGESIDGSYLESNFEELEHDMKQCQMDWDQYKVTLMCDSWTGQNGESIINFMIYCNEKLFFHRTINATGETQNASFLYDCIRKVIVDDIGIDRVMQIVTDNGSNYKKACAQVTREFPKIFWQPCAAHTINLLLKSIGKFTDVERVISSAQRICKFFYNHNNLRAEMKRNIGGELYRWNATRFGTVFIFLQSFWDRKDKFRQWMASEEWANSRYNGDAEYIYADECLSCRQWWDNIKFVLELVSPIYSLLRYADSQKIGDSPESAVQALSEFQDYKANKGIFGTTTARLAAISPNVTPTTWWSLYGGDTKELQKYALRIVSQCISTSGCERNWSRFSLVQTKLRNKLCYIKLHKLVYVNHNLKLRVQHLEANDQLEKEKFADPIQDMIDCALFDHTNPITEWLNEPDSVVDQKAEQSYGLVREKSLLGTRERGKAGLVHDKRKKGASEDGDDEFDENESESDDIGTWDDSDNGADDEGDTDGDGEDEDKVPSSKKQQGLKEERISNPCPAPEMHGDDETALAGEGIDCRPRRACRNKTKDIYSLLGGVVSPYIC